MRRCGMSISIPVSVCQFREDPGSGGVVPGLLVMFPQEIQHAQVIGLHGGCTLQIRF